MSHSSKPKGRSRKNKQSKRHSFKQLETLPLLYPNLAGIDIGSRVHYVSVPSDRAERSVRTFGCTTPDLYDLALWLKQCGITHVVMESTGVYWVPVACTLEDAGLVVALVDAREAHRLSARKTDVYDCQWIRQLYACGMLRNAFRPQPELIPVRSYWRQRQEVVSMCATALHHMQKALELMNLQLHKVISDIAGKTGMGIMRAIVEGQRDPQFFLSLVQRGCKASSEDFVKALTGHYRPEQVTALHQALQRYDLYHQQLQQLDEQVQDTLKTLPGKHPDTPAVASAKPPAQRRKNQAYVDLNSELIRLTGVDLTQVEGIDTLTAFTIISEQGIDMTPFPTEQHFSSHLGLCSNNTITGGRIRKKNTRPVQSRAAQALRISAQSLARSKTALGAFYRRIRARADPAVAIVATAHKLAKIIYRMLKYGEAYVARGMEEYEKDYKKRLLKNLRRQARKLDCEIVVIETGEVLS